jgi:hypothetical protein
MSFLFNNVCNIDKQLEKFYKFFILFKEDQF